MPLVSLFVGLLFALLLAVPAGAQSWQWATKLPDVTPQVNARVKQLFAEPNGVTVVLGTYDGTLTLGSFTLPYSYRRPFVGRLDRTGQWTSLVALPYLIIGQAALTATGDLILAGYYDTATLVIGPFAFTNPNPPVSNPPLYSSYPKSVLCRVNPAGICTQAVSTAGPGSDYISCLQLDPVTGDAVAFGSFSGTISVGNTTFSATAGTPATGLFVARMGPAGAWTQAVRCGAGERGEAAGLAVTQSGEVVVGANYTSATLTFGSYVIANSQSNTPKSAIARLSPAGTWTKALGVGATIRSLTLAPDGGVTIQGNAVAGTSFNDIILANSGGFIARSTPAGIWKQVLPLSSTIALAPDMVAAADGSVTLAGAYRAPSLQLGTYTLGGGSPSYPSGFVARLNAAGNWNWVNPVSNGGDVSAACFLGDALIVGGFFGSGYAPPSMQIGATTLTTNDGACYLAYFTGLPLATRTATPGDAFILVPNPATTQVRLLWPAAGAAFRTVQLLDVLGREVRRQQAPAYAPDATLDVAGLPFGTYVVRCGTAISRLRVE